MLGKRKRETVIVRRTQSHPEQSSSTPASNNTAADIFKKYFETTFDPLPDQKGGLDSPSASGCDDDDSDNIHAGFEDDETHSEWSGISEHEPSVPVVEVVDHAGTMRTVDDDPIDKIFQKSFMSHKPPRDAQRNQSADQSSANNNKDDVEESLNLKHDLDLQRLLRESRLLEQSKKRLENGAQRHKATELRLQTLGSKVSLLTQEKMPMSHRKGMLAKASSKEIHRRKEARENGIILEKSSKKHSVPASRRERGVDVPVVGRFKGGTLQLSRKDVASIQGPLRSGTRKSRR